MNKDQVTGTAKDAAGKVPEKAGQAIGHPDQQGKGIAKPNDGNVERAVGDVKESPKDTRTPK